MLLGWHMVITQGKLQPPLLGGSWSDPRATSFVPPPRKKEWTNRDTQVTSSLGGRDMQATENSLARMTVLMTKARSGKGNVYHSQYCLGGSSHPGSYFPQVVVETLQEMKFTPRTRTLGATEMLHMWVLVIVPNNRARGLAGFSCAPYKHEYSLKR